MTDQRTSQSFETACTRFVEWLDGRVLAAGRGDETDRLDVEPSSTFWLGRLASEEEVEQNRIGDRAERLDPCAIGIRLRPAGTAPWTVNAIVGMRAWIKESKDTTSDPRCPWRRLELVKVALAVTLSPGQTEAIAGHDDIAAELSRTGAPGLSAELRVELEDWHSQPELVIQVVNTSPAKSSTLKDTHLYETSLEITGLSTEPFILESLPDSFRYDRRVPAYGINVGVQVLRGQADIFHTTDAVVVDTYRPAYWNSPLPEPDLRFDALARNPIPLLEQLVTALAAYNDEHWSASALSDRGRLQNWDAGIRKRADEAAAEVLQEWSRLQHGLDTLCNDQTLQQAFRLMNRAIAHSARGRGYDAWRPFQLGFLLQALPAITQPADEAGIVDTVWFATGGGKTETYLGLLVTAALYDRLTGKTTGLTAWSRFPLRMLSLQQTQRFADALAGAELVRRAEGIKGAPISLGFLVGSQGTPNRIEVDAKEGAPDPEDQDMPARYQVLLICPFCGRTGIQMRMDRRLWRLSHECPHEECPWPNGVKLRPHRCIIACVARRGQQVVAGDRLPDRIGIGVLAKVFPPELVDRVVDEAGVREQRKRTLPARVVVYLLLAMVLYFQSGYGEVWNKLVQGLEWARQFRVRVALGMQPSPAAVTQARQRLGWQVMQRLLEAVAGPLAGEEQETARVAGMRLAAIDGLCLDVPATAGNGAEFGYPGNDAGPGPFPQVRVVGLGECGTRAVLGAELSPLATGEQPLARKLLPRLSRGDLLLADRNFLSHGLLTDVLAAGVHVLWRAKSDIDLPVLEVLPDGTYLSRIADPAASRRMRRKGAGPKDIPGIAVRVIEYSVTSKDGTEISETFTLVTDITDPAALSAEQAADAYARRWQLETCFDELETSLRGGAAVVLRSKSPPMIRQEIYAMLCCYQAIRTLISHAADDAGLDPLRVSFTVARQAIRSRISDSGCFSPSAP